ncbi:MAG: hypothetical protein IPJ88_05080 [Myxococcales bacterium]|nr:MAG: hypothetical protein IPJ88_05080 [Myxococcales bacterium]
MRLRLSTIGFLPLLVFLIGCRVNSGDIETWKGTVKGPAKIVAVALAKKYDMDLRVEAALALVEMDRQDVDGVAELESVLRALDEEDRAMISDGVAQGLEKILSGETASSAKQGDTEGPALLEVRAKDASYMLFSQAAAATRERLSKAIVSWFARDFNGRNLAGNYSAEQVIQKLGSAAAHQLIAALDPRMPQVALVKLAGLIGQTGDDKTKAEAATRLVEIEKEMEGPKFVAWLEQRIQEQAKESKQDVKPEALKRAALLHQENFINTGAIPAMGQLADQKIIADRLLKIAATPSNDEDMVERRWRALAALEGKATTAHVDTLLALALNASNPSKVRDYAFDRLGDVRSKNA